MAPLSDELMSPAGSLFLESALDLGYDVKKLNKYFDSTIGQPNNKTYNAAIGEKQQKWLKQELKRARSSESRVIVFSHSPVRPPYSSENLWNSDEIDQLKDVIKTLKRDMDEKGPSFFSRPSAE